MLLLRPSTEGYRAYRSLFNRSKAMLNMRNNTVVLENNYLRTKEFAHNENCEQMFVYSFLRSLLM